jgi:hypothetical protein
VTTHAAPVSVTASAFTPLASCCQQSSVNGLMPDSARNATPRCTRQMTCPSGVVHTSWARHSPSRHLRPPSAVVSSLSMLNLMAPCGPMQHTHHWLALSPHTGSNRLYCTHLKIVSKINICSFFLCVFVLVGHVGASCLLQWMNSSDWQQS